MQIKTTTKFKLARAIALLITGSIIGGIAYNKHSNTYEVQLNKAISQMSESQLQDAIKECDIALERLQQTIDADETNPEERFQAREAYKSIQEQRAQFQKRLDKIKEQQNSTINFHDVNQVR